MNAVERIVPGAVYIIDARGYDARIRRSRTVRVPLRDWCAAHADPEGLDMVMIVDNVTRLMGIPEGRGLGDYAYGVHFSGFVNSRHALDCLEVQGADLFEQAEARRQGVRSTVG